MTDGTDSKIRFLEHRGEVYLSRPDLLETISQVALTMEHPADRAVAENLVAWLIDATRRVEP